MGYALGVDLGTAFTAAAVAEDHTPTMLGLGNRALQIPSVLFLQDNGKFLVGEAAERRAVSDPSRVAREFKRRLGDHVPILVAGAPYSAQALTARLLRHVIEVATERLREPPASTVLTHPANWGPYKLDILDQVVKLADLEKVRTCPEPQAAAVQYASKAVVNVGERIAVYDLGAGTFDICVLEKTPQGFTVLGTPDGIEQLGGIDFDQAVFRRVHARLSPQLGGLDPHDPRNRAATAHLRRDCIEAKEALSSETETMIPVSFPGLTADVPLTRVEFESLIAPALADTIAVTKRAIASAHLRPAELSGVVLIGGSSRIPLVAELLQSELGVAAARDTHPKHDVVLGALRRFELADIGAPPASAAAGSGTHPRSVTDQPTRPPVPATEAGASPARRSGPATRGMAPSSRVAPKQWPHARTGPRGLLAGAVALLLVAAVLPAIPGTPAQQSVQAAARLIVNGEPLASSKSIAWDFSNELAILAPDATSVRAHSWIAGFRHPPKTVVLRQGVGSLALPDIAAFLKGPVRLELAPIPGAASAQVLLVPSEPWFHRPAGWLPIGLALFALAYAESVLRTIHRRRKGRPFDVLGMAAIGLLVGMCFVSAWWGIGERIPAMPLVVLTALLAAIAGSMLVPLAASRRVAPSATSARAR